MPELDGTSLFFAGSDDESEDVKMASTDAVVDARPSSPVAPAAQQTQGLFFADSDEDEDVEIHEAPPRVFDELLEHQPPYTDEDELEYVDIPTAEEPRASSVSSASSRPISRSPSIEFAEPPTKKRRLSPPPRPPPPLNQSKSNALIKKSVSQSMYLGTFLVGNAWSTAKGKGYIKSGEQICILREDPDALNNRASTSAKGKAKAAPNGRSNGNTTGKKQLSVANMFKAPQKQKKKRDTVVRITNTRGFEFARLPADVASWVSRLLDQGIIEFKGSTMIDCPDVLHGGADLIVSLSVYIRPSVFQKPGALEHAKPAVVATAAEKQKAMFNEGQESAEEQMLRERKAGLVKLFEAIGLRPNGGGRAAGGRRETGLAHDELTDLAKLPSDGEKPKSKAKTKVEIVGDGEEVEVDDDAEDLSENQLNMIYKKAQANDRSMGDMEPGKTFTLQLRGYQKQALLWMHSLETGAMDAREAKSMHPLWDEYAFPDEPMNGVIDLTSDERPFYFNSYSGELSLEFPKAERRCRGGILADEMGMGKTIMLSALIQTNRGPDLSESAPASSTSAPPRRRQLKLNSAFKVVASGSSSKNGKKPPPPSATLIVAPMSLLTQWAEELLRSSAPGTLNAIVWHGTNRLDLDAVLDSAEDLDEEKDGEAAKVKPITVVITSYGVLASEHAKLKKSGSPIFDVEWLRVVLDEAHHCKSRQSKTAKAVYDLKARRRWAVTGTPIVNRLEDLHSLLQFLDYTPWSDYAFFRSFITLPFLDRDPKAIEIVQVILESILLRREKDMRDTDGKKIVDLPPKEITVEKLVFSPMERKIYDSVYVEAKRKFENLNASGLVGKNFTHILAMLMQLRRAVLHPSLVLPKDDTGAVKHAKEGELNVNDMIRQFQDDEANGAGNAFAETVLANLGDEEEVDCVICMDVCQNTVIVPGCMHRCCKDCMISFLETCAVRNEPGRCPTCSHQPISESDLLEVVRPVKQDDAGTAGGSSKQSSGVVLRRNDFRSSTKLEALIDNLRRLRDQDPCFRAVVFSQFTAFLDLIQALLARERFEWHRFDGQMDAKKRTAAIADFKAPSRVPKVLIVSLKAGGVGLNLTVANHVFMMDCWWNAAIESQAIDRVHRIGQEQTVYVKHFIVDNTIEGRILQIQKRKTAIVKEAFRGKSEGDPESLENLKIMFGDE